MGEIKVTEVYGETEEATTQLFTDDLIISEELKGLLDLGTANEEEATSPDLNEMSIVVEADEAINGLVYGDLISLASSEYLTLRFNAKSKCSDMLQVLKASTSDTTKQVTVDVTGDYGFHVTSKNIEAWEMRILNDRSALLTLTIGTNDVTFR
jgi:hypothetical protein